MEASGRLVDLKSGEANYINGIKDCAFTVQLANSLRKANISTAERTRFYEQVFNSLNTHKLTSSDVNCLLAEFSSSSLDLKIKKFLANFADKSLLDVWLATKSWSNRSDILE